MSIYYIPALLCVVLASISQTLLKKSAGMSWPSPLRQYLNIYVITGYGLLGISLLTAVYCYKNLGYMKTVMLEPIGYILVLIIGCFVFGEKISLRKILGMCLIIAGILSYNLF